MDLPRDPFNGSMMAAATALHELFVSLVQAGFSQFQAMELTKTALERSSDEGFRDTEQEEE